MRDLLHRRQIAIKLNRAIEIGAGVDPLQLQTHVIWAHIAQLKHPGFNGVEQCLLGIQLTHQLNRQAMGIDEIAIHEQVTNAPLHNQGAQKGLELRHGAAIGNPLISREAKFMERKTQLGDIGAPRLKMVGEPREECTKRPHQHQHRALYHHFSHARLPPRGRHLTAVSSEKGAARHALASVPNGGIFFATRSALGEAP